MSETSGIVDGEDIKPALTTKEPKVRAPSAPRTDHPVAESDSGSLPSIPRADCVGRDELLEEETSCAARHVFSPLSCFFTSAAFGVIRIDLQDLFQLLPASAVRSAFRYAIPRW